MATTVVEAPDPIEILEAVKAMVLDDMVSEVVDPDGHGDHPALESFFMSDDEIVYQSLAVLFSPFVMRACADKEWYTRTIRAALLGILFRYDNDAARKLLNANDAVWSAAEEEA